jgi:hypothetical protein
VRTIPVRVTEVGMEVLRWVLFFVLALGVVVYAIFWLAGRPVPWLSL